MLKTRLLTAIVAVPLLILLFGFAPSNVIYLIFLALAMVSVFETSKMVSAYFQQTGETLRAPWNVYILCAASYCVLTSLSGPLAAAVLLLLCFGYFSHALLQAKTMPSALSAMQGGSFTLVYSGLPWVAIWGLYKAGDHGRYIFLMLAIVMLCDAGGFFGGRFWGSKQLTPTISPKKTWEGVYAGLVLGTIGAFVMNLIFGNAMGPWWLIAILGMVGSAAGIVGDLVESAIKRAAGVKDSGVLFPGHGGLLDRTDSIVFASPVILVIVNLYNFLVHQDPKWLPF